jgi:GT2 family glycosyltransferase
VSVVIPVHDQHAVTYRCLAALLEATNDVPYEVIVVDDASTDETRRLEDLVHGIRVIHSTENRGFLHSCNMGARSARGGYVTFLNNDTEPTARWLDEMVLVFRNFADVGLVGSKLIYPDGRLQEAGGIVWFDGNPWNYGRGMDPELPEFCHTRPVDYLSGASITLDMDTWQRVGGFSEEFAPAYFEDTDLAFKVRMIGRKVVYAPMSVVIHHEGLSSGPDAASNMKRYQDLNRPLFMAKWADAMAGLPRPGTDPRLAAEHRAGHRRALYVRRHVPRPTTAEGGYAAYQEMRLLQSLGYTLTFMAEHRVPAGSETQDLRRMGVEVAHAPHSNGLVALLEARGAEFDLICLDGMDAAVRALAAVQRLASRARTMLMLRDIDASAANSRGSRRIATLARGSRSQVLRAADVLQGVDVVMTETDVGEGARRDRAPTQGAVVPEPQVVDVPASIPPPAGREGVAFHGISSHPPDRRAVEFLWREVMPAVRDRRPDTTLHVYGSGWPGILGRLPPSTGVSVQGDITDIWAEYGRRRVGVVPVSSGPYLVGRIADALACGLPLVLSPDAGRMAGLGVGPEVFVAERLEEWAESIVALIDDDGVWRSRSDASRRFARDVYSFERGRSRMRAALISAGEPEPLASEALVVRAARPLWSIC